jgi:CRP-like cAMP-binding protein
MSDDDFDFTKPAGDKAAAAPAPAAPAASAPFKASSSRFYNAGAAELLFRASGKEERFPKGQQIFVEAEKAGGLFKAASRMYFLAEGEVQLTMGPRPLDIVKKGEIFGEMAVITGQPRSATATARADCHVFSMDAYELQNALGRNPEFALMLASVMYDRLRFLAQRLAGKTMAKGAAARAASVFEPQLVAQLEAALPSTAILRHRQETLLFKEGQQGTFMYLVKSGRVAIAVGANIVEVVGPGGTFGEMAIVDQSPRTARAGTLEETELIAIDRAGLVNLIKLQPAFAMALLRGIADRLRHMNSLL